MQRTAVELKYRHARALRPGRPAEGHRVAHPHAHALAALRAQIPASLDHRPIQREGNLTTGGIARPWQLADRDFEPTIDTLRPYDLFLAEYTLGCGRGPPALEMTRADDLVELSCNSGRIVSCMLRSPPRIP